MKLTYFLLLVFLICLFFVEISSVSLNRKKKKKVKEEKIVHDQTFKTYDEESAKKYWHFSMAAYCKAANIKTWNVNTLKTPLPKVTDITVYQSKDKVNQAFLAYDQNIKTIVLAFRGTDGFWNTIQDLKFFGSKYQTPDQTKTLDVHRGFLQAYKNLDTAAIMAQLKNLKNKYPSAKVVVTGHSLGGAMANFGFLDACKAVGKVDTLITFGSPRVGSADFARYMTKVNCGGADKIRVVNHRDPVPHVPKWRSYHGQSEVFYKSGQSKPIICTNVEDKGCSRRWNWTWPSYHSSYFGAPGPKC